MKKKFLHIAKQKKNYLLRTKKEDVFAAKAETRVIFCLLAALLIYLSCGISKPTTLFLKGKFVLNFPFEVHSRIKYYVNFLLPNDETIVLYLYKYRMK